MARRSKAERLREKRERLRLKREKLMEKLKGKNPGHGGPGGRE